jgi:hypothetical protein
MPDRHDLEEDAAGTSGGRESMSEMRALSAFPSEVREEGAWDDERQRLERKVGALEESNRRLREELQRAASQHARVAGLLAASHRLHSTLDRAAMLIALNEALAGLVGCEEAAVLEMLGTHVGTALVATRGSISPA